MDQKIIAVANPKGGCGKSTTAMNLAAELARRGNSVLMVDCDPQATLSNAFKVDFPQDQIYMEDLVGSDKLDPSASIAQIRENLAIIPTLDGLGSMEDVLKHKNNVYRIRGIIEKVSHFQFDYVILDPPGTTDIFMSAVLMAATDVIIPVRPTDFDFAAFSDFKALIQDVRALNPNLSVRGVLFNQVISASKNAKIYRSFFKGDEWEDLVMDATVRLATSIANSPGKGTDAVEFQPRSKGAEDYRKLTEEVLAWT